MMMALLLAIFVVLTFIMPVITKAAPATPVVRSQPGTFDGTNSPTITVGGNCPPVNVRLDVTGHCEGTGTKGEGCGTPVTITGNYGKFIRRDGSTSTSGACFVGSCSVSISNCCSDSQSTSGYSSLNPSCGCSQFNEALSMGGSHTSSCAAYGCSTYSCTITTYYTPCTKDPQVTAGASVWKYSGLVLDTSTVSIPIGTNSNPSSSTSGYVGTKVPAGNLVLGSNSLPMSALELNKFGYTLYWTEETAPGGGDADHDGYYSNQCTLGNDCDDSNSDINPGHLEVPGNGKDDNCDGFADVLFINSMADITAYCPYTSTTRTYSCTGGWENIHVQNDISLGQSSDCPWKKCGPCKSWTICGGASPRNIIFTANNEFSAKNFYADNPCGDGGSITIEAKKITATSLNTYGSECHSSHCNCNGPYCGSNTGGPITLKADTINVGSLNANDGVGRPGTGGKITVTADTTTINSISSSGGAYSCSYDYGYDDGSGSGGSVDIKAKTATLGPITLNGGGSNYASHGGSGGSLRLEVDTLTLNGPVRLDGAHRCGNGGPATILAGTSIFMGAFTDNGDACGSNGYIKIGADSLTAGTISTSGSSIGGGTKTYLDTYAIGSLASSGYVSFVSDNMPDDQSFIHAGGQKRIYGRSKTALFGFNTSIPDTSAKSFRIKLKDLSGAYLKISGFEWSETGTINPDEPGKVSTDVGRETQFAGFKGGKKYYLELTTSTDAEFDAGRCTSGAATCSSHDTGFVEWS